MDWVRWGRLVLWAVLAFGLFRLVVLGVQEGAWTG